MTEKETRRCGVCGAPREAGCGCLEGYSEAFQSLVEKEGARRLLDGSHFEGTWKEWENQRRFIADAIDRDGTILDIGPANGLLLACLKEWSGRDLVEYGIDVDKKIVREAQRLFPEASDRFIQLGDPLRPGQFPDRYDLIYWNVWDNADFSQPNVQHILKRAIEQTRNGGRLIMGFYDEKEENNLRRIQQLTEMGYTFTMTQSETDPYIKVVIIDSV